MRGFVVAIFALGAVFAAPQERDGKGKFNLFFIVFNIIKYLLLCCLEILKIVKFVSLYSSNIRFGNV